MEGNLVNSNSNKEWREWEIKMRRIRAEQEREFIRYHKRSYIERLKDNWDQIFGRVGLVHQFFFRWRIRLRNAQAAYIKRYHPDKIIFVRTVGHDRKNWIGLQHQYHIHTFFGVYEFVKYGHKPETIELINNVVK
jgi:hypothetical protein